MKRLCSLESIDVMIYTVIFRSVFFYFMGSSIFRVTMSGSVKSQLATQHLQHFISLSTNILLNDIGSVFFLTN
jgi:hypothetical protein